jgi:hypothetical protein
VVGVDREAAHAQLEPAPTPALRIGLREVFDNPAQQTRVVAEGNSLAVGLDRQAWYVRSQEAGQLRRPTDTEKADGAQILARPGRTTSRVNRRAMRLASRPGGLAANRER